MFRRLVIAMSAIVAALIVSLPAEAQETHWSADIRAEEYVFDEGGKLYVGYLFTVFGNISGDKQFEYDGVTYTVLGFYITNEPRSLLVGLTKFGGVGARLPDDSNLAFRVDGKTFALSDISRTAGEEYVVWNNSGLDHGRRRIRRAGRWRELAPGDRRQVRLGVSGAGNYSDKRSDCRVPGCRITRGSQGRHQEDAGNPGTPPCANLAARNHASGLEIVMGGRTASDPDAPELVTIP